MHNRHSGPRRSAAHRGASRCVEATWVQSSPRGHGVCQVREDAVQDGRCRLLRTCMTHTAQPEYGRLPCIVRLGRAARRVARWPGATRRRAQSGREQAALQVESVLAPRCQVQTVQAACNAGACVLLPRYVLDPDPACAYKKGLCAICGKQILDTSRYKQSN